MSRGPFRRSSESRKSDPCPVDSYLWTLQRRNGSFLCSVQRKVDMTNAKKSEVLQGTLDLMILKTLHALGPQHGFGIARRIEQVSRDVLQLNEGTVYTSLLRLLQQRWIAAEWGTSENNRKAKFYSITARGERQRMVETENWERICRVRDFQPGIGERRLDRDFQDDRQRVARTVSL